MRNLTDSSLHNVYLRPGELYVSRTPALVSTVLGSCVSVVLHAPERQVGAMCHAMLPSGPSDHEFRYVDSSVLYMYERLRTLCGHQVNLEAKLFGGADVLTPDRQPGRLSVGSQNVQEAKRVLESLGLKLAASDTGGVAGRKLFFYSGSGEVYLRQVRKTIGLQ